MTADNRPYSQELDKAHKLELINSNPPRHVAIILDGNRRYAKAHGESISQGHQAGLENAVDLLKTLKTLPVEIVTLWGFSSDNWERPSEEVYALLEIFRAGIEAYTPQVMADNAKVLHLGRKDRFESRNPRLAKALTDIEAQSSRNTGQTIVLALDWGGRDHERRVMQRVADYVLKTRRENPDMPDEDIRTLAGASYDWSYDLDGQIPPADLIFRSSGEQRISDIGFLNGKQTELYFSKKLWPEITGDDIVDALVDFAGRERRQGR